MSRMARRESELECVVMSELDEMTDEMMNEVERGSRPVMRSQNAGPLCLQLWPVPTMWV